MGLLKCLRNYSGMQAEGSEMPSRIFRLVSVDSTDGITYCLQHYFTDLAAYNAYKMLGDLAFREELSGEFGDKLIIFASVLSEV